MFWIFFWIVFLLLALIRFFPLKLLVTLSKEECTGQVVESPPPRKTFCNKISGRSRRTLVFDILLLLLFVLFFFFIITLTQPSQVGLASVIRWNYHPHISEKEYLYLLVTQVRKIAFLTMINLHKIYSIKQKWKKV